MILSQILNPFRNNGKRVSSSESPFPKVDLTYNCELLGEDQDRIYLIYDL